MIAKHIQKIGTLSLSFLILACGLGCATGKAPTEPTGVNPVTGNGSVTWYVDAVNGSTFGDGTTPQTAFKTIQQGANIALPGDTVQVADGTYTNSGGATLLISTPGTAGAYITYTAAPGAHPVITGDKTFDIVQLAATASYIIVEGFTIMGDNGEITLAEAQQYESEPGEYPEYNGNCMSTQYSANSPLVNPHAPAGPDNPQVESNHIQFLNNIVYNCSAAGLGGSADYLTISGNTIYNSSWYTAYGTSAIDVGATYDSNPSDTTTPYRVIITNNIVYGNQEFIPWIGASPSPHITDGEAIIIDSNLNSSYISGGTPSSSYPAYSGRTLIANNVIYSNGSSAVEVFESQHVDVVNNSTYDNDISPAEPNRGEISISGNANDVNVYNNIAYSATGAAGNPIAVYAPVSNCNIDYNLFYGGVVNDSAGCTVGTHNITANPLYVDPADAVPANVSLRLQTGSPAIGAGTTMLAPPTDINGNPRPVTPGAAVTMGAYSQ
jgi:hypothetical protein